MKHLDITVTGKVQGVFFRKYTQAKAQELGLKGTVKNLPDGSVHIEAEGTEEQLGKLVDWCDEGSPNASVEDVQVTEGELKNYPDFSISRG